MQAIAAEASNISAEYNTSYSDGASGTVKNSQNLIREGTMLNHLTIYTFRGNLKLKSIRLSAKIVIKQSHTLQVIRVELVNSTE